MRRKKYTHLVCIYSFLCIACIMGGNYYFNYLHDNAEKIYFQDMKNYLESKKIVEEVEQEPIVVMVEREDRPYINYSNIQLQVNNIQQNPELPTGCEVTALATIMNYLNPNAHIDKVMLADSFMDKGNPGEVTPDEAFLGNPHNSRYSFGANAPVLVNTANKYYKSVSEDQEFTAYDMTGTDFNDLLKYVIDGYPVMVWETINLKNTYISTSWTIDGKEVPWYSGFHCMVLIGFDYDKQIYYMADPLKEGITSYDMNTVEERYNELGKQAIVIY